MAEVESFTLDHNKVIAPYVRLIANEHGKKGDVISNFDIRFLQPNKQEMPTGVVHTFEHLLADLLRDRLEGIIDISPFGCRTGFHLILWEERSPEDIARALKSTLEEIVKKIQFEDIQGVSAVQCGNYRDHSLFGAKEYKKLVSAGGAVVAHGEEGQARNGTATPKLHEVTIALNPIYAYPKTTQEILDFSSIFICIY